MKIIQNNKNKKSIIKKNLKIIDQIEKLRSRNNRNWMDILRVAFRHSPKESAKILKEILDMDKKLLKISKKLSE